MFVGAFLSYFLLAATLIRFMNWGNTQDYLSTNHHLPYYILVDSFTLGFWKFRTKLAYFIQKWSKA